MWLYTEMVLDVSIVVILPCSSVYTSHMMRPTDAARNSPECIYLVKCSHDKRCNGEYTDSGFFLFMIDFAN